MQKPLRREHFVYLCYFDDSCEEQTHQIIGAVIVPDVRFMNIEGYFGYMVEEQVPEDLRGKFEIHSSALFHQKPPFEKIGREEAIGILSNGISVIVGAEIPVIYAAVNLKQLRSGIHATASPIDIAFRLCLPEIERWFAGKDPTDFGILIGDNTTKQNQKEQFQQTFRSYRKRARAKIKRTAEGNVNLVDESRGVLPHLHDDMYFGDSTYSVGIQLADICCFFILRHLQGKEDTEYLYKKIEPYIFSAMTEPKENDEKKQ